jgi:hypothetical protein
MKWTFAIQSLRLALLLAVVAGCGRREEAEAQPATVEDAVSQAVDAIKQQADGSEPIPAEELEKRFPDRIAGMLKVDGSRQDASAMGVAMSTTSATYRSDEGAVQITITDTGGMAGMVSAGAAWALVDFDRTTANGYERTIRIHGFKGMESGSNAGGKRHTELALLPGGRFIVQLEGTDVEMDVLKDALDRLDVRSLPSAK